MENVQKYRDIKLTTTEKQRNYFVSKPNYHNTKLSYYKGFHRKFIDYENEKNSNTFEQ